MMPKGTKVMRDTSLVMNMLLMKHRNTSVVTSPRTVPVRLRSSPATYREEILPPQALYDEHEAEENE